MPDTSMRDKGLLIQLLGVVLLLLGMKGFFIFRGTALYLHALAVGVLLFAICLFKGGAMYKKSKMSDEQK